MRFSEDHIALAAEYVLGTLDAAQRAQVETMMSVDADFAALVQSWETKLGELHAMVDPVEPPAELWHRIREAAFGVEQSAPLPFEPLPDASSAPEMSSAAPRTTESQVVVLGQRMRRWRGISAMTGALAAALALFIVTDTYRPDLLPKGLRRAPVQVVVTQPAPAPVPASQFVAVLQRDAASPAFIMTVDTATKSFTVRRVSAEREAGKDYELWLVSDRFPAPRSLGVIGDAEFTRAQLAAYDQDTINAATYAVTVEPQGGSPTGVATGPIVFTGKLVEAVPPAPPSR
jgi:anti-sigma-K factor RskA